MVSTIIAALAVIMAHHNSQVVRPSDFATLDASDHLSDAAYLACHGSEYYHGFVADTLVRIL